jgi:hypothetical protein
MITKQKIDIYNKYLGDSDGFVRCGSKNEKELFSPNDWALIETTLQDLEIIDKGLCSEEYRERTYIRLNENFDSTTITLLTNKQ